MAKPVLVVLIASTRPQRKGPAIAKWFTSVAEAHPTFEVRLVDLAEVGLPLLDEPNHPRMKQYQQEHTKRWSAIVDAADAFVFVTPEYNYNPPPSLLNALDYLYQEWLYKPVGIVSYGGISGGLRSAQALKLAVTTLKMMPLSDGVVAPNFFGQINSEGVFEANESQIHSAHAMLDELAKWSAALSQIRHA